MAKTPTLMFVQFPHPGAAHKIPPDKKSALAKGVGRVVMNWNHKPHKRKFLKAKGVAVDGNNRKLGDTDLYFWGEWEPTSYVSALHHEDVEDSMPRHLHEPVLLKNSKDDGTNTDPFVFGKNFMFSCCRQQTTVTNKSTQTKEKRPTVLQRLQPGSIIVFGSTIGIGTPNPRFVVDTVFVVGEGKQYESRNARKKLAGFVPEDYYRIMGFDRWDDPDCAKCSGAKPKPQSGCTSGKAAGFTCYKGVSYAENPDGPFSFVPCRTELSVKDGKPVDFERPVLQLTHEGVPVINPKSVSTFKTTPLKSPDEAAQLWNLIKQTVLEQGFSLGVSFSYEKE